MSAIGLEALQLISQFLDKPFPFCLVVFLSKDTFIPQKVLVIPRKRWLHPDMTEKLFTGMLSLNKTKTKTFLPAQNAL